MSFLSLTSIPKILYNGLRVRRVTKESDGHAVNAVRETGVKVGRQVRAGKVVHFLF